MNYAIANTVKRMINSSRVQFSPTARSTTKDKKAKAWPLYVAKSRILQLQWRCATKTKRRTAQAAAKVRTHGLWPAAIHPHVFLVFCLMAFTSEMDLYSFTDSGGVEG